MEKKLTIAHLVPYLPYGLQYKSVMNGSINELRDLSVEAQLTDWMRPLLRPLHLFTDINSPAMNDLNCDLGEQIQINSLAWKAISYSSLDWSAMEVCFRNHIDVFGLIEAGLAIEKGAEG